MKKLILVMVVILLVGLIGWLVLAGKHAPVLSPRVALPDGTSLRIFAVTYGTNHVVGSKLAAGLPDVIQHILRPFLGRNAVAGQTITTLTPELMVWVERETNNPGAPMPVGSYFMAQLSDGSNFVSGPDALLNYYMPSSGPQLEALRFGAFPRRDREITLNIFNHDSKGGAVLCTNVTFANPLYGNYPQWQAETLPATKRTGGVEATLQRFETGHDNNSSMGPGKDGKMVVEFGTARIGGRNNNVVYLNLRPLTNSKETWQASDVEVSDATGNRVHNTGISWSQDGVFSFSPGLWPGEAAWKLKVELKRTEGFRPDEVFVFKHVPLGELDKTNILGWKTNFGGITVTLQNLCRRAPNTNNSWSSSSLSTVHFTHSALPAGTQLDLLRMVCDTGKTNRTESWSSSSTERDYNFRVIPLDARTADFTFAVQQSRTVEFMVRPELPKAK